VRGPDGGGGGSAGGGEGGLVLSDKLKLAVPQGGSFTWCTVSVELMADGKLRYSPESGDSGDVGAAALKGSLDLNNAIGMWLLGQSGSRHLDVIEPGRKVSLAADKEVVLERWRKEIEKLMPHKPTRTLTTGWLDKKGDVGGGWKTRYFALLSSRELLYFETETSSKRKGTIDLKEVFTLQSMPDAHYNYEDAFELITPKRRWVLCPQSKKDEVMWLEALRPLIAQEGGAEGTGDSANIPTRTESVKGISRHRTASVSAATRLIQSSTVYQGWLEREEEAENWQRRFFVLTKRSSNEAVECVLEYYLDERLTADEDSETLELAESVSIARCPDASRPNAMKIVTSSGATSILAAASADLLASWMDAISSVQGGISEESSRVSLGSPGKAGSDDGGSGRTTFTSVAEPGVFFRKSTSEVHCQGWMAKRGEGAFAGWSKRWFVLQRTGELHYFADANQSEHKGHIDLAGLTMANVKRSKPSSAADFQFVIQTPKRKWQLNAGNQKEWDMWEAGLSALLS